MLELSELVVVQAAPQLGYSPPGQVPGVHKHHQNQSITSWWWPDSSASESASSSKAWAFLRRQTSCCCAALLSSCSAWTDISKYSICWSCSRSLNRRRPTPRLMWSPASQTWNKCENVKYVLIHTWLWLILSENDRTSYLVEGYVKESWSNYVVAILCIFQHSTSIIELCQVFS